MSHYPVAVFTKKFLEWEEVHRLLAPYDESIEVPPYVDRTKAQIIEAEKKYLEQTKKNYAEWLENPEAYEEMYKFNPSHIEFIRKANERFNLTDEELYQQAIAFYEPHQITDDGSVLTTYNPQSKWDWYEIGGRWTKMLRFKEVDNDARLILIPDHGGVRELDFEAMAAVARDGLLPYQEAMKQHFLGEKHFLEHYPTEEEYIRRSSLFYTYAVITPDGAWHSPGSMGWWGLSSENANEMHAWQDNYHERFIKPGLDNKWYITIVDCHI